MFWRTVYIGYTVYRIVYAQLFIILSINQRKFNAMCQGISTLSNGNTGAITKSSTTKSRKTRCTTASITLRYCAPRVLAAAEGLTTHRKVAVYFLLYLGWRFNSSLIVVIIGSDCWRSIFNVCLNKLMVLVRDKEMTKSMGKLTDDTMSLPTTLRSTLPWRPLP